MKKQKNRVTLPAFTYLQECFTYFPETGRLFWKARPEAHFPTPRASRSWNARYAHKPAFTTANAYGHLTGSLAAGKYVAHRIIWKLVTGEEPPLLIDHKDRNPKNNRWNNFRAATKGQNNINSSIPHGVHFDKSRGRWAAYTKFNGKKVHLGRHDTEMAARQARIAGVRKLFGEFAP